MTMIKKRRSYDDIIAERHGKLDYLRDICPGYEPSGTCTVIAMAAALDIGYDEALYAIHETLGLRPGTFSWSNYESCFPVLGYRLEEVPHVISTTLDKFGDVKFIRGYNAKTVASAERDPVLADGRYILSVSRGAHAVGMVDGEIIDWTKGRRHRIHKVFKVIETA